ncbi:MAG: hypothetical protein AAFP03_17535 [Cyanobacteria bacterium J06598_3]
MTVSTQGKLSTVDRAPTAQGSSQVEKTYSKGEGIPKRFWSVEMMRASTPLALAIVGAVLGIAVLGAKAEPEIKAAGFGLASSAIAGAAGLAQSHNGQE